MWTVYNSLKTLRERVRQGYSQVEVHLKRRHDLIPRLSASVIGLMKHEQDVQTRIASLRNATAADALLLIIEKYPEMKSSGVVSRLQKALADTENRLELARAYYNNIAKFYNAGLERTPDIVVARIARLKEFELMSVD